MNEKERAAQGLLYDANNDASLIEERNVTKDLCWQYNQLRPSDRKGRTALLKRIFGETGDFLIAEQPFYCDYGRNISVGEDFYANHNLVILDGARVKIGSHVYIAPNCVITTAGHPLDAEQRNRGLEYAFPITIGDNVWLGAGVMVLPGVTIGSGSIIGAGSVVNRDIPAGVVAAGNPCRVIREITEEDRRRYGEYHEE